MTTITEVRRAPVQATVNYWFRRKGRQPGTVAWEEHLAAWHGYHRKYPGQSAERIAERGGFGYEELVKYLGHEPTTWEPCT